MIKKSKQTENLDERLEELIKEHPNGPEFPVLEVKLIPIDKIQANDYNPNKVASREMKLLMLSILEDGLTMPIVLYYNEQEDNYTIVDGFHRFTTCRHLGCKEIPATVIDKSYEERMESTIRHNRARGSHQISSMSDIVLMLTKAGWSDSQLCAQLGMDLDEVVRLKQITGLRDAFINHEFSKSWEEFQAKHKAENQNHS